MSWCCQPANSSTDALSVRPFEDVRGKVAVVERGSCTFIDKIVQAKVRILNRLTIFKIRVQDRYWGYRYQQELNVCVYLVLCLVMCLLV